MCVYSIAFLLVSSLVILSAMASETQLLDRLSVEEKVQLLSAVDWWRTPVIKKDDAFIPHIKVPCLEQASSSRLVLSRH